MRASYTKRNRMFIYAIDVAQITGRSYKTALKILNDVRIFYDKPAKAFVTYKEFCAYMHLDEKEVLKCLN
ncbi:hypothetical protein [Myroides odoratus]|uniref:hypothetical protein n=1 Tax=Myroides odoratus TaxID=256 RepID=UPI0033429AE5